MIVTMELQQGNWDIGLIQYWSIAMIMDCLMSCLKSHEFSPLNNAPSNWSTVELYSRESPSRPWVTERIWKIKCDISSRFFKRHRRLPTSDEILNNVD